MKVGESLILAGIIYYFFDSLPFYLLIPLVILAIRELVFDYSFDQCQFPPDAKVKDSNYEEKKPGSKRIVVVTGAGGFVGSFVVDLLLKEGRYDTIRAVDLVPSKNMNPKVENIKADITKIDQVLQFCEGADTVYHLAGLVTLRDAHHKMKLLEEVNVKGAQNVVNACIRKGVKTLLHLSSASVGFDGHNSPLNQKTKQIVPTTGYGATKLEGERRVLRANNVSGLKTIAFRPCTIYGEKSMIVNMAATGQPSVDSTDIKNLSYIYAGHVAEWMRLADVKLTEIRESQKQDTISGKYYYIGEDYMRHPTEYHVTIEKVFNKKITSPAITPLTCKIVTNVIRFLDWYTCASINHIVMEMNHGFYLYAFNEFVVDDSQSREIFGFKETIPLEQIIQNMKNYYGTK